MMRRIVGLGALALAAGQAIVLPTMRSAPDPFTSLDHHAPTRWKRRETKKAYRPWKVRAARKAQRRARRITRMHAR